MEHGAKKAIVTAVMAGGLLVTSALVLPACTPKAPSDPQTPLVKTDNNNQISDEPADLYGPAESVNTNDAGNDVRILYGPAEKTIKEVRSD